MGKRRRGYGAVYWRPDGRWEGRFVVPAEVGAPFMRAPGGT